MGIIGAAIVLAIGVYCSFTLCSCESSTQIDSDLSDLTSLVSDALTDSEDSDQEQTQTQTAENEESTTDSITTIKTLSVHVCGAVMNPGVYELNEGDRIIDAINIAGGFSTDASRDYLNLAQLLSDSIQIYVPTVTEVEEGYSSSTGSGTSINSTLVNINTADINELMTLPGIGEYKARNIVDYRNSNGSFGSIEDIKQVEGIKDGVYTQIQNLICI